MQRCCFGLDRTKRGSRMRLVVKFCEWVGLRRHPRPPARCSVSIPLPQPFSHQPHAPNLCRHWPTHTYRSTTSPWPLHISLAKRGGRGGGGVVVVVVVCARAWAGGGWKGEGARGRSTSARRSSSHSVALQRTHVWGSLAWLCGWACLIRPPKHP